METTCIKAAVIILMLFTVGKSFGQIEKGKWISSAGAGLDINDGEITTSNESDKTSSFNVTLRQGYFIKNNLAVGIGLGYSQNRSHETFSADSYVKDKQDNIEVYIFAQYYRKLKGKFYYSPIFLVDYFKEKGRFERKDPGFELIGSTSSADNYALRIDPAQFSFRVNDKLMLETGFGYIMLGKRKPEIVAPTYTETGKTSRFVTEFSPFITNIKVSLFF